ncbi:gag-pol polyprotein [Zymoseptoria brevis]|uniref:Gag-pol polyprotein n=1 Tax=Zymoseptoria brevis TaxID=1047168 RepID=A0A0F4GPD4_9PEZI|nr:gag-pol polyprotein [Zymoseptoria brevis]
MTDKKVEWLKGQENHKVWSIKIKALLQGEGLWTYLTGERKAPIKKKDEDDEDFLDRTDKYKMNLQKARGVLIQSVSKDIAMDLEHFTSAKEAWDHLEAKYKPSGMAYQFSKYQEWQQLSFDGKNIDHFASAYKSACTNMKEAKLEVDEAIQLYQFITLVSPYYNAFTTNLRERMRNAKDKETLPKLDDVIAGLLDEQRAQSSIDSANFIRSKNQNGSKPLAKPSNSNNKDSKKCTHCGSTWHNADKCRHLHPEQRPSDWTPKFGCDRSGCKLKDHEKKLPLWTSKKDAKESSAHTTTASSEEFSFSASAATEHITERTVELLHMTENSDTWYVDSGSSSHFTNDYNSMTDVTTVDMIVNFGKGASRATALGSIKLRLHGNGRVNTVKFTDVLFVEGLRANLLSTEKLKKKGLFYRNDNDTLFTKDAVVADVVTKVGIPQLVLEQQEQSNASSHVRHPSKETAQVWHDRFGHFPEGKVDLIKNGTEGMVIKGSEELGVCHDCRRSDAKRIKSRVQSNSSNKPPLTHWNADVVTVSSDNGLTKKYFTNMACASSKAPRVAFHPTKDGAFKSIQDLNAWVKNQTGRNIQTLHIDGGREFGGNKLVNFCTDNGIELIITTPKNSESNGRIEVSNHLVCVLARKLLSRGRLGKAHWQSAIEAAAYIIKKTPSPALNGKSPYQVLAEHFKWPRTKPYIGNLRIFGCTAFVLDQELARGDKFADRATTGRLVGFEGDNIYKVYLPSEHKVVRSVNVTFDEAHFESPDEDYVPIQVTGYKDDDEGVTSGGGNTAELTPPPPPPAALPAPPPPVTTPPSATAAPKAPAPAAEPRKSTRTKQPSQKALDNQSQLTNTEPSVWPHRALTCLTESLNIAEIPTTHTPEEAPLWQAARQKEMDSLHENGTWRLVRWPLEKDTITALENSGLKVNNTPKILKGRWVDKVKKATTLEKLIYKSRWVVKGFSQRQGIDYAETYAATTKAASIKVLMTIIAHYDLEARQYDIITAFLNTLMKEFAIFVEQPHGFTQFDAEGYPLVCLLLKSLYGLKQSPMLWQQQLTVFLDSKGFKPLFSDPCIYQHRLTKAILAVYVDDLILAALTNTTIIEIEGVLTAQFKMKCLGELSFYLGCHITRDRTEKAIYLTQEAYIDQLLDNYNADSLKALETPLPPGTQLIKAENDYEPSDNILNEYQSLIGRLMWPSIQTRADITFAVAQLSRHLVKPTTDHLNAAKRILRYLKGTRCHGITIKSKDKELKLVGYTDSSYADNRDDSTSTGGYAFHLNDSLISWKSVKQRTVALSSTEAEWNAAVTTCQEAAYLSALCSEFSIIEEPSMTPVTIKADNMSQIALTKRGGVDGRTKHMNNRLHWLREQVNNHLVTFQWVPTEQQAADGLTKALTAPKHHHFCQLIGITDLTKEVTKKD